MKPDQQIHIPGLVQTPAKGRRKYRALTLHLPWPWLMVSAPESIRKRVENRDWQPPPAIRRGEWFLLHAGRGWDEEAMEFIQETVGDQAPAAWHLKAARQAGQLLAFARVVDVTGDRSVAAKWGQAHWFFGPYGWLLDVRQLAAPVPCRGWHKLWDVEAWLGKDNNPEAVERILSGLDAEYQRLGLAEAA